MLYVQFQFTDAAQGYAEAPYNVATALSVGPGVFDPQAAYDTAAMANPTKGAMIERIFGDDGCLAGFTYAQNGAKSSGEE